MAASYWESTQRKYWTFTKEQLNFERKKIEESERNLVNMYPLPDRRLLSVYFSMRMSLPSLRIRTLTFFRTYQNGKASGDSTTSFGDGSSLCPALLHESRNPTYQSSARLSDLSLSRLQDGRVPPTYSHDSG